LARYGTYYEILEAPLEPKYVQEFWQMNAAS
jgi:hypothetical protein